MVHAKFFAAMDASFVWRDNVLNPIEAVGTLFDGMINDHFTAKKLAAANRQCLTDADDVEHL